MSQPSIYVSCVSAEFRSTRRRVAALLTKMGYRPVMQEITGTEAGDLRVTLRNRIFNCQGLIQIAGHAYGPEAQTADREFGRVSYAQFEYLYARKTNLPTWLIIAGDECTRDTLIDQLNSSAETAGLQQQYLQARNSAGQILSQAGTDADLDRTIQQLQRDFANLAKPKATTVERPRTKVVEKESNFIRIFFGFILVAVLIGVPVYISRVLRDPGPPRPLLTVQERMVGTRSTASLPKMVAGNLSFGESTR